MLAQQTYIPIALEQQINYFLNANNRDGSVCSLVKKNLILTKSNLLIKVVLNLQEEIKKLRQENIKLIQQIQHDLKINLILEQLIRRGSSTLQENISKSKATKANLRYNIQSQNTQLEIKFPNQQQIEQAEKELNQNFKMQILEMRGSKIYVRTAKQTKFIKKSYFTTNQVSYTSSARNLLIQGEILNRVKIERKMLLGCWEGGIYRRKWNLDTLRKILTKPKGRR